MALPLPTYVTQGKLLHLPDPSFSHLFCLFFFFWLVYFSRLKNMSDIWLSEDSVVK